MLLVEQDIPKPAITQQVQQQQQKQKQQNTSALHTTNTITESLPVPSINNNKKKDSKKKPAKEPVQKEKYISNILYREDWKEKKYKKPPPETISTIMRNLIIDTSNNKSKDRVLLTAVVNSGMLDYTFNWIESLERTNQGGRFLVFAIDEGVYEALTERGYGDQVTLIPEDWFHVPLSSDFSRWKTNAYRPITHAKTLIVERLLYLDITVWFSDVDIVLLDQHARDVMLFQMNERHNTDMIFSQEVDQRTVNSGFYMIRSTYRTKQLMDSIINEQDKTTIFTQQKIMNGVLRSMFGRDLQKSPYRLLDMLLFPNGKYYFRLNLPYNLGIKPMMVHVNYIVGDKKRESLKAKGLWYIEEDE
jgi:hypothetical protein